MNCGEIVFATYMNWLGKPHEMIFEHSWGNQFYGTDNMIREESVKKYYNLELEWHDFTLKKLKTDPKLIEITEPVMFLFYLEDADWIHGGYSRQAPTHSIIAIGKNEKGEFLCYDPIFTDELVPYIPKEGKAKYATLNKDSYRERSPEFILQELRKNVDALSKSTLFDDMLEYKDVVMADIRKHKCPVSHKNLLQDPILFKLNRGYGDLYNYANMLTYITKISSLDLNEYAERMRKIAKRWELNRNYIVKYYCIGDQSFLTDIENEMLILTEEEKKLCMDLTAFLNENVKQ